jgi:hypothetical protein
MVDVDDRVLVDVVTLDGAASVVELGAPAASTTVAVGVSAIGSSTAVGVGGVSGWAVAIVAAGAGAVGAVVVALGAEADDVAQSERFNGLGVSPGSGAGGSYPGGGTSTPFWVSANDQPSIEPGGGVRLPAPVVL